MRCKNCGNSIRVIDGLCVTCRLGDKSKINKNIKVKFIVPYISLLPVTLGLLILLMALGSKYDFIDLFRSTKTDFGILAPMQPIQQLVDREPWTDGDYRFHALAQYSITARVLLKNNYWFSPDSDISPIDITFGWGPMSDQRLLDRISLSSGYRSYSWKSSDFSIDQNEINRNSSNHHLVPKNSEILEKLKNIKVASVVTLKGYLLEITKADGWRWVSSLSRTDSGGGACELMWVEEVI